MNSKTRHGYCRKGKHGPRKLYRVQAQGITIGWWCQQCIEGLKPEAESWKRKETPSCPEKSSG